MFYVIGRAGEKFGPADITTLQEWAESAQLEPTSLLENAATGERQAARSLPELTFPASFLEQFQPAPELEEVVTEPTMPAPAPELPTEEAQFTSEYVPGNYYRREVEALTPNQRLPAGYRQWNWGGFFVPGWWGLFHGKPVLAGAFLMWMFVFSFPAILIALFLVSIVAGALGNEWAWSSARFKTPDEMIRCQQKWNLWSILVCLIPIAVFVLFVWMMTFG